MLKEAIRRGDPVGAAYVAALLVGVGERVEALERGAEG